LTRARFALIALALGAASCRYGAAYLHVTVSPDTSVPSGAPAVDRMIVTVNAGGKTSLDLTLDVGAGLPTDFTAELSGITGPVTVDIGASAGNMFDLLVGQGSVTVDGNGVFPVAVKMVCPQRDTGVNGIKYSDTTACDANDDYNGAKLACEAVQSATKSMPCVTKTPCSGSAWCSVSMDGTSCTCWFYDLPDHAGLVHTGSMSCEECPLQGGDMGAFDPTFGFAE
jgi:hypothetical protein